MDRNVAINVNRIIRFNLGDAYLDNEQYLDALTSYQKAVDLIPKFTIAHFQAALLLLKNGELNEGSKHFDQVIRLDLESELPAKSKEYLNQLGLER